LALIALAAGKRTAKANHRISFRVSSQSHFHALPDSTALVSLGIVASRIDPHSFGTRQMAAFNGIGSVGVFSVTRLRRVWRCRIADVGANGFGGT
jgi:hypothetical protein